MNMKLNETISRITAVDQSLKEPVQAHLDDLTKPRGSLGRLEETAMMYCLATGTTEPVLDRMKIFCFAGDHGVADEGVSAFPREVTPQMVANMIGGGAAINVLCRHGGIELDVVDMGVAADLSGLDPVLDRKVRAGASNIAEGPAMTVDECRQALEAGIELACDAIDDGVHLLGTGEMGIANTTPSAALMCAYLDISPRDAVGRGTGIDDAMLRHKVSVVERALTVNSRSKANALDTLAALGGFEIAGIAGLILGAASRRVPVVVDGFISSAAAVSACAICPKTKQYLFFSHLSEEAGHAVFAQRFKIRPLLDLSMRLGEGTGAALAMRIIQAAIKIYNQMATFSSAGVSGTA